MRRGMSSAVDMLVTIGFPMTSVENRDEFSKPVRVNSQPKSAVAVGTIRGAQIAIGQNGRVHVAWNGGQVPGQPMASGMFYTRLADDGKAIVFKRDAVTYPIGARNPTGIKQIRTGMVLFHLLGQVTAEFAGLWNFPERHELALGR